MAVMFSWRQCSTLAVLFTVVFSKKQPPHIVLIVGDDVGWNDVGYHNEIFKTPNIDSLANSGVKLNQYYSGEICAPSRNMMMSGRYGCHTGLPNNRFGRAPRCLPLDEVTMGDKMKESGYSTHLIGKWHCGFYSEKCMPYNRGFDSFFGYLSMAITYYSHLGTYGMLPDLRNNTENAGPMYDGVYSTHLFTQEAERLIQQHDSEKPLFLVLAYNANHPPLQVPSIYKEPFESDITDTKRLMLAAIASCMDEGIGNVTNALKHSGLYDNSVIVFISDNGGNPVAGGNNWPLRGRKDSLYEGGVRVPAFVHSPLIGKHMQGTKVNELIHITDWLPTFVHLADGHLDGTKPLDGVNQWKAISDGVKTEREDVLLNLYHMNIMPLDSEDPTVVLYSENGHFDIGIYAGIRKGKWKLLTGDVGVPERTPPPELDVNPPVDHLVSSYAVKLFDIENDPNENINLALDPVHRDQVMELLERLGHYRKGVVRPVSVMEPSMDYEVMGGFLGPWERPSMDFEVMGGFRGQK